MNDIPRIPKKYEANYVFKQDSRRLWSLLTDESKIEQLSRNTSIISTFLNLKHKEKEKEKVPMIFEIQEGSQLDYIQTITWHITLENSPKPTEINYTFTVISDTLANSSLVTLTLNLTHIDPKPSLVNQIVDGCKRLCIEILHGINNYLSNQRDLLYEYESIQVACSIEKAWKYIINFEILKANYDIIVAANGGLMKEGTKIGWNFPNETKPIECEVYSIDYSPKKKKYEYVLKFSDGNHKKRIVKFTLVAINDNTTFISFFHEIFEHIAMNRIDEVRRRNQTLISSMKHQLENAGNGSSAFEPYIMNNNNSNIA